MMQPMVVSASRESNGASEMERIVQGSGSGGTAERSDPTSGSPFSDDTPAPITPYPWIEAQGWIVNEQGQIVLVAPVHTHH